METRQPPVRDRTLWFSVGAGVVVWAFHFFASYVLVDQFCRNGWFTVTLLGLPGIQAALLILTLIGVAIVGAAGILSYRHWRSLRGADDEFHPSTGRYRFMMFIGLVMSTAFIALMLLTAAVSFILPTCR